MVAKNLQYLQQIVIKHLNSIRTVFPASKNLLCRWHIEKNVLTHCKKHVNAEDKRDSFIKDYTDIVYSSNEAVFYLKLDLFKAKYSEFSCALDYVLETFTLKSQFVEAWTTSIRHFNSINTSRVESSYLNAVYVQKSIIQKIVFLIT